MLDRIDERDKQERMHRQYCKILECELYTDTVCGAKGRTDRGERGCGYRAAASCGAGADSRSANYGNEEVTDEVTKGQIDKILHEKTEAIRSLIEQNKQTEEEQDIPEEMASAPIQHIIE